VRNNVRMMTPNTVQSAFGEIPRIRHAITPTPIHYLRSLSKSLGVNLYCKRDDLTGFGYGGNKVRKLEFLVADALRRGCRTLVTCGSNQSNWCRMAAAVGAANGLEVHLVLGGGEPSRMTGNLLLDCMLGANLHHLPTDDGHELEAASEALTQELQAADRLPYRMIMGGSTGLGAIGYVEAMHEIMLQEAELGIHFDAVVLATGSGGTQAGLIAGKQLGNWPGRIIGVTVSRSSQEQQAKVRGVLDECATLLRTDFSAAEIIARDEYFGAGYRKNTAAAAVAIETFARLEGVFLDHVYTGKAASAVIDLARRREFGAEQNILFLHTGGTPQLFE
jgi:D-cysteine desulfhydrase family pyridoxal phosphate-dependent enzyme